MSSCLGCLSLHHSPSMKDDKSLGGVQHDEVDLPIEDLHECPLLGQYLDLD